MDINKLQELLKKLKGPRRELWDLTYEELDFLYADAKDFLDQLDLIAFELEQGIEKVEEIITDIEFEEELEWDEEEE